MPTPLTVVRNASEKTVPVHDTGATRDVSVAPVVAALSQALDLSTGQPLGHSMRSCLIGMRIAGEIGLSAQARSDLFYALLIKDCGCSSNASATFHALGSDDLQAKRDVKTTDWTRLSFETLQYAFSHVAPGKPFLERSRALFQLAVKQKQHTRNVTKIRCEQGSTLARLMELSENTASAILSLDEHWDGQGNPEQLRKLEIPILSRIMLLAQTLENYFVLEGPQEALAVARKRSKKWFDPDLVAAACSLAKRGELWKDLTAADPLPLVLELEPKRLVRKTSEAMLDSICLAFAQVVDAKSPFTFNHSNGVANAAVSIARTLGMPRERIIFMRQAALLHDLGKLGVPNTILEKPGKLDESEWQVMRKHPFYTWQVLTQLPGMAEMSEVAASHHEKLNGQGYFRGLTAEQLSLESRILAVADVFDALSAKRPYRDSVPRETVFQILRKDAPHALDASCVEALDQSGIDSDQTFVDLQILNERLNLYRVPLAA